MENGVVNGTHALDVRPARFLSCHFEMSPVCSESILPVVHLIITSDYANLCIPVYCVKCHGTIRIVRTTSTLTTVPQSVRHIALAARGMG